LLTNLATAVVTSCTIQASERAPSQTAAEMAPPEPPRRVRGRRAARPKFTGFEDDFSVPLSSAPESMVVDQPAESQSLFVSQNTEIGVGREPSQPPETQTRSSRKRPASPIIEEEEDIMEEMAPAAAALKRRRLARGEPTPPPPPPPLKEKPAVVKPLSKKAKKEIDVLEMARQQREQAEELARAEQEALQEQLEDMDIKEMRNLAKIEEIEVKRTNPAPRAAARADENERWDDKWNGRKNFKKFRRRGVEAGPVREKILIKLEEVKKKDFGIGDDYWDAGDSQRRRRKDKGKGKETQDISQRESQARPKSRAAERAAQILASEAEEEFGQASKGNDGSSDSDLAIVERPQKPVVATTSRSQRSQKLADKTSKSQNLPAGNNKRTAEKVLTKPAPVKKARQMNLTKLVSGDSDDDELKFRFKKR
jgi:nijmegen breakage syndrome protein 1